MRSDFAKGIFFPMMNKQINSVASVTDFQSRNFSFGSFNKQVQLKSTSTKYKKKIGDEKRRKKEDCRLKVLFYLKLSYRISVYKHPFSHPLNYTCYFKTRKEKHSKIHIFFYLKLFTSLYHSVLNLFCLFLSYIKYNDLLYQEPIPRIC